MAKRKQKIGRNAKAERQDRKIEENKDKESKKQEIKYIKVKFMFPYNEFYLLRCMRLTRTKFPHWPREFEF